MPRKILLVEDDEQVRSMLRRTLKYEGFDVIEAANGKIATDIYFDRPIDLVVTDIFMPEKAGLGLIKELVDRDKEVKIIAISGGSVFEAKNYLEVALKLGAKKIFSKPVDRRALVKAINEVLEDV